MKAFERISESLNEIAQYVKYSKDKNKRMKMSEKLFPVETTVNGKKYIEMVPEWYILDEPVKVK